MSRSQGKIWTDFAENKDEKLVKVSGEKRRAGNVLFPAEMKKKFNMKKLVSSVTFHGLL